MTAAASLPLVVRTCLPVPESDARIPVIVLAGGDGPCFVFTAGIHANEYVHEQALVELAKELGACELAGTVILVPVANVCGFSRRGTSMVPDDETNLNRVFPGDAAGNLANRIAHALFEGCIKDADYYADLHSGDYFEDLATHVYYLSDVEVSPVSAQMARHVDMRFACPYGGVRAGNTVAAAAAAGVPSILVERGGMGCWSRAEVDAAKADVLNLLRFAGILAGAAQDYGEGQLVFADDDMVDQYAPVGGFWYPAKRPGEAFDAGEALGEIRDVFGATLHTVVAPRPGVVIYQTGSLNVVKDGPLIACGYFAD